MKKIDKTLLISVIILSLFGLLMIYSSSCIWADYKFNDPYKYLKSQGLFLIFGYFLIYIISKINYQIYYKYSNYILLICSILLVLVLIPGIGSIRNGSRSWFGIGSFGIQPSEFAKLGLIIFTSKYLTNNKIKSIRSSVFPILLVVFFLFGLIMLQPDFGTGTILVMTIIAMLFVSGCPLSFFIKIGMLGMVGVVFLILMAPYRVNRIVAFLNPWSDPLGTGFQTIQSLFAIGPGGLFGLGFGNSIQKHFYLPEPQTDFIFSIISEELGIIGIISVAFLFLVIILLSIKIAIKAPDSFSKFLVFGIIFQLSFQALLNLSVVVGLVPVTGVTLPFFSYGGSSLLISLIGMGIILNIAKSINN